MTAKWRFCASEITNHPCPEPRKQNGTQVHARVPSYSADKIMPLDLLVSGIRVRLTARESASQRTRRPTSTAAFVVLLDPILHCKNDKESAPRSKLSAQSFRMFPIFPATEIPCRRRFDGIALKGGVGLH